METLKRIWRYLTNLEWTEKRQAVCVFCDRRNLQNIRYEASNARRPLQSPGEAS